MTVVVHRTPVGADVVVDGRVRATFVGDLDRADDVAALRAMVAELFGDGAAQAAIEFFLNTDLA